MQGNLDPLRLVAGGKALEEGVESILDALGAGPLIFNLGHGITPEAPIEHVEAMLRQVRGCEAMTADANRASGAKAMQRAATAIVIFVAGAAALFYWDPDGFYPWAKAIHVIAVISWMAGMLYLPRLFVYHADAEKGSVQSETFKVMERRLLRAIINPAMIVTWVFGLWLAWKGFAFSGGWLHAKIGLVRRHVGRAWLFLAGGSPVRRRPQ